MTAATTLESPTMLARRAAEIARDGDYGGAAQGCDEAADIADAWGDHIHADELRETAQAYWRQYTQALREAR